MALRVKQEAAVGKPMETISDQNTLSANLLETASALAENLIHAEPFVRFQEAERRLQTDQEARQLLAELSELQQKIRTAQLSKVIADIDIKRLRELQSAINSNDIIQEYDWTQEKAIAFLREVNQEISQLLGIDFASLTRRPGGCC
jgi:cell fate (sporulation/competence/biofilm development) regulator YlbF (YheA/YmcA/DUF963 family)